MADQSYQKHTRFLPPFHFFVMPVLLINFINAVSPSVAGSDAALRRGKWCSPWRW